MTHADSLEAPASLRPPGSPITESLRRHPRILVVDDQVPDRRVLKALFAEVGGYDVCEAENGTQALDLLASVKPDLLFVDMGLPGGIGLEVLAQVKAISPQTPVIMLTSPGEGDVVLKAVELGADQFLVKPVSVAQLSHCAERALARRHLLTEVESLRRTLGNGALALLLAPSRCMQDVVALVRRVATSSFSVLITGETGVGKELVARAIHDESSRASQPFVAVDCGALPEALFESELFGFEKGAFTGADRSKPGMVQVAAGGTLFFDEIGNLPAAVQTKLLRLLQERKVQPLGATSPRPIDVRVVAATNASLEADTRAGRFRSDLYYRLAELTIRVCPLRERPEDIMLLARRFREEASLELRRPVASFDQAALDLLVGYSWPGNVRELRNVIRRAVLMATDITIHAEGIARLLTTASDPPTMPLDDLVLPLPIGASLREVGRAAAHEAERRMIKAALRATSGNRTQAARMLKVDYKTLYLKLKRYGYDVAEA
jgi:DNA-binding NtrC family response regulator